MRRSRHLALPLLVTCLAALLSCGDSPVEPLPVEIDVMGRLERGDSVQVIVTREGTALPAAEVQIALVPAARAHLLSGGWVHLDQAGSLDIVTTVSDGVVATAHLQIAAPPLLVYDYLEAGNRDIYVVALDGGDLRRLTTNAGDDQHPTAAAGQVVFTSYRTGNAELFGVPLAGGTELRLTTTTASETEPALSTNGQRLAYISSANGSPRIWQAAGDATGAAAIVTGATGPTIEAQPTWSNSGDRLAFMSTNAGNADLYLFTPSSNAVTPVPGAGTSSAEVEPAWVSDGSTLVFVASRATGNGVYRVILSVGVAAMLIPGSTIGQPTVLADGRVVFTQFDTGRSRLRWFDPLTPTVLHDIPTGAGSAAHPSVVR